jgi:hypothetical protein
MSALGNDWFRNGFQANVAAKARVELYGMRWLLMLHVLGRGGNGSSLVRFFASRVSREGWSAAHAVLVLSCEPSDSLQVWLFYFF